MKQFPVGWICTKLGELCKLKNGYAFKSQEYKQTGIPVIRISDISNESVLVKEAVKINESDVFDNYIINNGDILIAMSGATTGKFGIYKGKEKAYQNQRVGKFQITFKNILADKYLYFLLFTIKKTIEKNAYGGAQPNISAKDIEEIEILVPPFSEQQRIVTKIEELFSELDNGIESLKVAQQQLKVYRQAVLKWAFEGKLTEEWRKNMKGLPLSQNILAQIQKDKVSNKKNNQIVCGEDLQDQSNESKTLPKSWMWTKLINITEVISDGDHQPPPKSITGIPFITISNINAKKKIDFTNTFCVNEEYYDSLKSTRRPQKGDILYTVTGSFGIPVSVDYDKKFCFQRHIGLIRPISYINHLWLYYVLQSPQIFEQAKNVATGTAQKTVPLEGIRNFKIPFVVVEEQEQIVQEIESRLSVCDKMEEAIEQSLRRAEVLRQSVLKKAFEGKLVHQDPNDEPAEKLLEGIRAEKETQKNQIKTTTRRTKK